MSAEYLAERLMDAIAESMEHDRMSGPDEDMRTGGWFFEVIHRGKSYEVLVTQFVGGGER